MTYKRTLPHYENFATNKKGCKASFAGLAAL